MRTAATIPQHFVPAALVIEGVAGFFGVSVSDLRGPRASISLTRARQVAVLLMVDHSMVSQVEIGQALGRRATTAGRDLVIAALKTRGDDQRFGQLVEQVRQRLVGGEGERHDG